MASAKPLLNAQGCGGARFSSLHGERTTGRAAQQSMGLVFDGPMRKQRRDQPCRRIGNVIARVARIDLRLLEPVRHRRRHEHGRNPFAMRAFDQAGSIVAGIVAAQQHDVGPMQRGSNLARRRSPGSIQDCRYARQRRPRDRPGQARTSFRARVEFLSRCYTSPSIGEPPSFQRASRGGSAALSTMQGMPSARSPCGDLPHGPMTEIDDIE